MFVITLENLRRMWPHGNQHVPGLIEGIVASQEDVYGKYQFDSSPMVLAHMFAQFSEECGQGLEMEKNGNAQRSDYLRSSPLTSLRRWRNALRTILALTSPMAVAWATRRHRAMTVTISAAWTIADHRS
jgi:hypothetical protein